MRILQVVLAFYPCKIWGGPPQNTLILSKALLARGHDVEVLTTNILDEKNRMSTHSFRGEWEGVPVSYLQSYWLGKRENSIGFILAPDLWNHRHLIRDADIIHIQGHRDFLFLGVSLLALVYRVPFIIQARGTLIKNREFGRARLKRIFDSTIGRFIFKKAKGAVALSDDEQAAYSDLGVVPKRVVKILNPFDPSSCPQTLNRQKFRQRYEIGANEKIVLFLSRLHEGKGLDLLIQAIAKMARPDIRFCIVGPDFGYQATVERLIDEYHLRQSVIITGPLYNEEKYEAYSAADVYVLPSKSEGQPTTVIEACFAGAPVILTRTCEMADMIDGRVGLAIEYDLNQLINALNKLLYDPELQQKFKQNMGGFISDHFSIDKAIDSFEKLYKTASNSNLT